MIEFAQAHWTEIAGVLALVIVIGERIAAITENKTDDKIFSVVHTVLSKLGLKFPEAK